MTAKRRVGFTLPLGPFQIHLPATLILPAARRMGHALEKLRDAIDSAADVETFGRIVEEARKAGDVLNAALNSLESPEVLPAMTHQLLYASLIAEALGLRFEVIDYRRETHDNATAFWWVDGRVTTPAGETYGRPGTSFSFDFDDEKRAEGALLSSCADAFIHSVYAVVPYFTWDRWTK